MVQRGTVGSVVLSELLHYYDYVNQQLGLSMETIPRAISRTAKIINLSGNSSEHFYISFGVLKHLTF